MSAPEDLLAFHLRSLNIPYEREFRFAPGRRYRADFAFPMIGLLAEVEGGTWIAGRHSRGAGFVKDCQKYNLAAELGYRVLRFTTQMVKSGEAAGVIERMMK
jgi:very-short-patch-repair endonuclease